MKSSLLKDHMAIYILIRDEIENNTKTLSFSTCNEVCNVICNEICNEILRK